MNKARALQLLEEGESRYRVKLSSRVHRELAEIAAKAPEAGDSAMPPGAGPEEPRPSTDEAHGGADILHLFRCIQSEVFGAAGRLEALRQEYSRYAKAFARAVTEEAKQQLILELARSLGASEKQLRGDRKSFARWFGHDAITERWDIQCKRLEQRLATCLECLGRLGAKALRLAPEDEARPRLWTRLEVSRITTRILPMELDSRVHEAVFRLIGDALEALPASSRMQALDGEILQFIYKSALHKKLDVWVQAEALRVLGLASRDTFFEVCAKRLGEPGDVDDLFVRRRLVELTLSREELLAGGDEVLRAATRDAMPFVRQRVAEGLPELREALLLELLPPLALEDEAPQVRAAAMQSVPALLERLGPRPELLGTIEGALRREKDTFATRMALHASTLALEVLSDQPEDVLERWHDTLAAAIEEVHASAAQIPVRRWASQALERAWSICTQRSTSILEALAPALRGLPAGGELAVPFQWVGREEGETFARTLSVIAQGDFPYSLRRGGRAWRVTRGHVFGFRLWRFLHELRNPSPDKRQAFNHTIGRLFPCTFHAPSSIYSELSETRVPGEPLFLAEEGGSRPYLPLVDQALSALDHAGREPVRIYSSEGVTSIRPPRGIRRRLKAYWRLTRGFPEYATTRNWTSKLQESPRTYVESLRELGFDVSFSAHVSAVRGGERADPMVSRFFGAAPILASEGFFESLRNYVLSPYENTILELAVFTGLVCAYFFGQHLHANRRIREYRRSFDLVVGGWGTRGKSGTERLKAALFNGMGCSVVSKTTGCEAMFLFSHPFGRTREMFLFRSYDKATIWEQSNVMRLSHDLKAQVFLWECMALTPSYVHVLQQQWVRDDLSTITNTYPDHEDLQGPAGIDIPKVISIFIPRKAKAFTTEDQMVPILPERAKVQQTELEEVTWIEAGLLTPDVLKRFPYDEHPNNIALVLALAKELEVPKDVALKDMADRVVADLGVLKTSPVARVKGRRLQFSNGCSANERHGTISNWIRCGFNTQDPVAEPGVWITTVVNNRADRIPRSRVFAKILVEDISADRHFLIGGNLKGLVGYIRQAWEGYCEGLGLWPTPDSPPPAEIVATMALRFRLPATQDHVLQRLKAMLHGFDLAPGVEHALRTSLRQPDQLREVLRGVGLGENTEAVLRHHSENLRSLDELERFTSRVSGSPKASRDALNAEFHELLWGWFQRKLVVIWHYYALGEQIINTIANETPPGHLNRVMGVQNIKGTGLDFVYRWQAWDTCYRACEQIKAEDPYQVRAGLRGLTNFHEFGVLSREHVAEALEIGRRSKFAQDEQSQAELSLIQASYEDEMRHLEEKLTATRAEASRAEAVVAFLESFLDAGDAVWRRKHANKVYADLSSQRISTEKAVIELQKLNKRQKGGWLLAKLSSAGTTLSKGVSGFLRRGIK